MTKISSHDRALDLHRRSLQHTLDICEVYRKHAQAVPKSTLSEMSAELENLRVNPPVRGGQKSKLFGDEHVAAWSRMFNANPGLQSAFQELDIFLAFMRSELAGV